MPSALLCNYKGKTMNQYVITWFSKGNSNGTKIKVISATDQKYAFAKFCNWLLEQPISDHLWNLDLSIKEAE